MENPKFIKINENITKVKCQCCNYTFNLYSKPFKKIKWPILKELERKVMEKKVISDRQLLGIIISKLDKIEIILKKQKKVLNQIEIELLQKNIEEK